MKKKSLLAIIAIALVSCIILASGCNTSDKPAATPESEASETPQIDLSTPEGKVAASVLQYPATNEDFRYNVYTYYVTISECLTMKSDVVVPDEIQGLPVITIENEAFSGSTSIINVRLGNNVAYIGDYAFAECPNLETIRIPSGLISIGRGAFNKCYNLSDIVIPGGVTEIEPYTCDRGSNLKTVTIEPGNGTERLIDDYSFANCPNLAHAWLPSDITVIEKYAFDHSLDNLMVYGYASSAAAMYSAINLVDFTVMDKDDYASIVEDAQNSAPAVGDSITGKKWNITFDGIKTTKTIGEHTAGDGKVYLALYFSAENITAKDGLFDLLSIETQVSGFSKRPQYIVGNLGEDKLLCGKVAAGHVLKGFVLYEVNESWVNVKVNFFAIDEFSTSESYFRAFPDDASELMVSPVVPENELSDPAVVPGSGTEEEIPDNGENND